MKAATDGAKPDWYTMPPDLEKVAICPLSGARATDACRQQPIATEIAVGTSGTLSDAALELAPSLPLPPPPMVYEDIFPVGAVPAEPCPLHNPRTGYAIAGEYRSSDAPQTPLVDAAMQHSPPASGVIPVATTGSPATMRSANPRVYVERVTGPDGITRLVMKQR